MAESSINIKVGADSLCQALTEVIRSNDKVRDYQVQTECIHSQKSIVEIQSMTGQFLQTRLQNFLG